MALGPEPPEGQGWGGSGAKTRAASEALPLPAHALISNAATGPNLKLNERLGCGTLNHRSLPVLPQLSSTYGPVFTVWLGLKPAVVLCGYEVVKDALLGHYEEFGGRPEIPLLMQLSKDYGRCLGFF